MPRIRAQHRLNTAAISVVMLAHAAGLAVFARMGASEAQVDAGGAPVINLTLAPAPRFDGKPTTPSQASTPAVASRPAAPALRPRPSAPVDAPTEVLALPPPAPRQAAMSSLPAPPTRAALAGQQGTRRALGTHSSAMDVTSGGGAPTAGDAARSQEDAYAAAVIAWVERHKGRPRDRLAGVVTVRFELDRQGRMRQAAVVHQTEDTRIGARALDALRAAQPFPRPPAGTSWTRREFTVRLDYRPAA